MPSSPHVLMLFLDGVGIGNNNPEQNPFFASKLHTFSQLFGGEMPHLRDARRSSTVMTMAPINATLGITGLPQSGTGQTSLLTGINASRFIGKHFGPYPYSTLKPILYEKNIFQQLKLMGKKVFYVNAFPPKYFEYIQTHKNRMSAISMSWLLSGFALNDHTVLSDGKALSADITSERWNKLGFPSASILSPQQAGKRLAELLHEYDFVLYEYYYTDHVGHSQSMNEAKELLTALDGLLEGIASAFNYESMLLIITSDHGNMEDLSIKTHTRNPVPFLSMGKNHSEIAHRVKNLTHVTPAIVNMLR